MAIALHAGWDVSAGVAAAVVAWAFGQTLTLAEFRAGVVPSPSPRESGLLGVTRTLLLGINAAVGLLLARWQWRRPDTADGQ